MEYSLSAVTGSQHSRCICSYEAFIRARFALSLSRQRTSMRLWLSSAGTRTPKDPDRGVRSCLVTLT